MAGMPLPQGALDPVPYAPAVPLQRPTPQPAPAAPAAPTAPAGPPVGFAISKYAGPGVMAPGYSGDQTLNSTGRLSPGVGTVVRDGFAGPANTGGMPLTPTGQVAPVLAAPAAPAGALSPANNAPPVVPPSPGYGGIIARGLFGDSAVNAANDAMTASNPVRGFGDLGRAGIDALANAYGAVGRTAAGLAAGGAGLVAKGANELVGGLTGTQDPFGVYAAAKAAQAAPAAAAVAPAATGGMPAPGAAPLTLQQMMAAQDARWAKEAPVATRSMPIQANGVVEPSGPDQSSFPGGRVEEAPAAGIRATPRNLQMLAPIYEAQERAKTANLQQQYIINQTAKLAPALQAAGGDPTKLTGQDAATYMQLKLITALQNPQIQLMQSFSGGGMPQ